MTERWKDIPGLEGYYQTSDLGRVRSITRSIERRDGKRKVFQGRVLSASSAGGSSRYLCVTLSVGNRQARPYVHQLIALAFIGDAPQGYEVHHVNGIPTDNRPCNLVYVHKGVHVSGHQRGEANHNAILTEQDVIHIHRLLAQGHKGAVIARLYGVHPDTISDIRRGRSWKHVVPEPVQLPLLPCDHAEAC